MTTEELLTKVESRLSKKGNPALPPEETLRAILDLGNELKLVKEELERIKDEKNRLDFQLSEANLKTKTAEIELEKALDNAKNYKWVANELGKFVRDIANRFYEGEEVSAARRVYDLNSDSFSKKRLNAYNYETKDEAWNAFVTWAMTEDKSGKKIGYDWFHEWLFSEVQKN